MIIALLRHLFGSRLRLLLTRLRAQDRFPLLVSGMGGLLVVLAVRSGFPPSSWGLLQQIWPLLPRLWSLPGGPHLIVITLLSAAALPLALLVCGCGLGWSVLLARLRRVRHLPRPDVPSEVAASLWEADPVAASPDLAVPTPVSTSTPLTLQMACSTATTDGEEEDEGAMVLLHQGARSLCLLIEGKTPRASLLVKATLMECLLPRLQDQRVDAQGLQQALRESLEQANARLVQQCVQAGPPTAGVASTEQEEGDWTVLVTGVLFVGEQGLGYIAHIGTQRASLSREPHLEAMAVVHADGQGRPHRLLGTVPAPPVDVVPVPLEPRNLVLLCSQGLWHVIEPCLEQTLLSSGPLYQASSCGALLDLLVRESTREARETQRATLVLLQFDSVARQQALEAALLPGAFEKEELHYGTD